MSSPGLDDPSTYPPYEGDAAEWRRFFRSPLKLAGVVLVFGLPMSCVVVSSLGTGWQREGVAYARAVLPRAAKPWSRVVLQQEGTAEFHEAVPAAKLDEILAVFGRRLGDLQEVRDITGVSSFTVGPTGVVVWARYEIDAQFEKAPGRITLNLVKRSGR